MIPVGFLAIFSWTTYWTLNPEQKEIEDIWVTHTKTIKFSVTGVIVYINAPVDCSSTWVIYVVTCLKRGCKMQYVGKTEQEFRIRVKEQCQPSHWQTLLPEWLQHHSLLHCHPGESQHQWHTLYRRKREGMDTQISVQIPGYKQKLLAIVFKNIFFQF